jgi:hypothetical protein
MYVGRYVGMYIQVVGRHTQVLKLTWNVRPFTLSLTRQPASLHGYDAQKIA